jgi:hypothetical protein
VVRALRALQVDVLTVHEAGMIEHPDDDQLAYAAAQGRVLFTANQGDFCRLHASYLTEGRSHAGIIVVTQQRYSVGEQVRRLRNLLAAHSDESMRNQIEFLSGWG